MKVTLSVLFVFLVSLVSTPSAAQDCDCEANFQWVKKTFEENDAGFQYIIDAKGEAAYEVHNKLIEDRIKSAKTLSECGPILYEWLRFFRSGHMGIRLLKTPGEGASSLPSDKPVAVYETVDTDIQAFKTYLNSKTDADYEGIWETEPYKIGIKKDGNGYTGFIVESGADTWTPGQVKLRITNEGGKEKIVFYMRDHTPMEYDKVELLADNYIRFGSTYLKRLLPFIPSDVKMDAYFRSLMATQPYMEGVDENSLLIRIPSFGGSYKAAIDSVIAANRDSILSTRNLIIDLRNNGGGSDFSTRELMPFLYTNPIRTVSVQFRSTPLNNATFLKLANDTVLFDAETRDYFNGMYEKMEKRIGEFVSMNESDVRTLELDTIYPNPANVAVIVNENCASATEQFLLAARQSRKVKVFGVTTFGALDVSNVVDAISPSGDFELLYCMSKSLRIPGMVIDDRGIQPDFYMDKDIPVEDWVKYITDIFK